MNRNPDTKSPFERILVVVDPSSALAGHVGQQAVLERVTELARAGGASIELFHACHDASLERSLFSSHRDVNREKEAVANAAATQMAELAINLSARGLEVSHEVRWDHPQADAILRKIDDCKPDLVMKATRGPGFLLGLTRSADWDLIRNSPCDLWLVKDGTQPISTVLSAIGSSLLDEDLLTDLDESIFAAGSAIAELYDASNHPVHAYQVPRLPAYAGYAPAMEGMSPLSPMRSEWQEVADTHGKAIARFARRIGVAPESIELVQGHPAEILPEMADSKDAGLIVLGTRHLGRWERLFESVTAEPLLAEAPCDLLFVSEKNEGEIPESSEQPTQGVPEVNLEMAITRPETAFKTPIAVVRAESLSDGLKRRILEAWEHDIQSELVEEAEGGVVKSSQAGLQREIHNARLELGDTNDDETS